MRFRLRTLLMVLAIGPPLLALTIFGLAAKESRSMTIDLLKLAACVALVAYTVSRERVPPAK